MVDDIVSEIRTIISDVATEFDTKDEDLYSLVDVDNGDDYYSIIDSLYLLEDTELAKDSFKSSSLNSDDYGLLYLLFYGVLNAAYMQQQATIVICQKMNLTENLKLLKEPAIFDFRNSFAAHSANRGGRGIKNHSFILDRHELARGNISGYSANHDSGFKSQDSNIYNLLDKWDKVLSKQLKQVLLKVQSRVAT